jgi:hypothetical protein
MRCKNEIAVEVQTIVSQAGYSMFASLLVPSVIDPIISQHSLFTTTDEVVKLFQKAVGFDLRGMLREEILERLIKLLIEYQLVHLHSAC